MTTMAVWQGLQSDSISAGNTRLLIILMAVVALSTLIQAVVVTLVIVGAAKAQKRVQEIAEELRVKLIPLIDRAETLSGESLPKIRAITDNLVAASEVIKSKTKEFDSTLTDMNTKTRAQITRVDSMITTTLTAVGALGAMIHQGIKTPLTEALGVVNAFKAGIDVLLSKSRGFTNSAGTGKKTAITVYNDDQSGM